MEDITSQRRKDRPVDEGHRRGKLYDPPPLILKGKEKVLLLRRQLSTSLPLPNLLQLPLPSPVHETDRDQALTVITLTRIIRISHTLNPTNDQYGRQTINLSMTDTRRHLIQDYLRRYTGIAPNH